MNPSDILKIGIVLNHKAAEKKKDELLNIRSKKRPWLKNADPIFVIKRNNKSFVPADVAIGYYIMYKYPSIKVDFIRPQEITTKRFKSNDIVYILIYDLLEAFHLDGRKQMEKYRRVLKNSANVYPPYPIQKLINDKCLYYTLLKERNIPVAPTYCITRRKWDTKNTNVYSAKLLKKIKRNKWSSFIAKPVLGQESLDFKKFSKCKDGGMSCRSKELQKYLNKVIPKYKSIVLQEYVPGFDKDNKEIRMYFIDGKYSYSIITTSKYVTTPKQEGGSTNVKHFPYLKQLAKRVVAAIPKIKIGDSMTTPILLRIDIGSGLEGVKFEYFINEVEFVPSLYIEDTKVMSDVLLANAMVKTAIKSKN